MKNLSKSSKKPELPLVSIYKDKGIEIINKDNIKFLKKISAYSLIQDKSDAEIYSAEMILWNLQQKTDKFNNTKWNRFLAKTIYNPLFDVTLFWEQIRTYKLVELKTKINNCIKNDDDIYTQYIDADFFIFKINESSDFFELITTLNKYYFDVKNEEHILKENEEWDNKQ